MKNHLGVLGGLLIAQLLVIVAMNVLQRAPEQGGELLTLDPSTVTALGITDADGNTVDLERSEAGWRLPGGAAADESKIMAVLERLAGMDQLWPVAATESSRQRFEVGADGFQRRLEIRSGSMTSTLYLGSSPGYRRVHARNAEADEIFSIEFATYEVPAEADEWLDRTQLQTTAISRIELVGSWTLSRSSGVWLLNDAAADADSVDALVGRLEGMLLQGVFRGETAALDDPSTLQLTDAVGEYQLTFRHDPAADEYVVTSSRVPGSFTVASYVVEQILVEPAVLQPRVDVKLSPEAGAEAEIEEDQGASESAAAADSDA